MEQITIIRKDGSKYNLFSKEPFSVVTSASQSFTLMGEDTVQLSIHTERLIDFQIGDKIVVGTDEYFIRTRATREILSDNLYAYEVVFHGVMYELIKSAYRDTDAYGKSSKSTFDLTYTLADFVKVIIYNVNRDYPGIWKFDEGDCPHTEPQSQSFSKNNCLQVLQNVCKQFNYEFRIEQKDGIRTIKIGKFGEVVSPPNNLTHFEWGKGKGLFKLKEQKIDDKTILTRLWVEGGNKNIRSDYRGHSDRLQLPYPPRKNRKEHILADGTIIPAGSQTIGISDDSKRYLEDVELKNKIGSIEDTEYFDIFPSRTGVVTDLGSDIYSFKDATMNFDLMEKDAEKNTKWLVGGVSTKLTFITGKLAGQQFEVNAKGGYDHSTKTFKILKFTDERGMEFPSNENDAFRFAVGDKYKLTEINLPTAYIEDAEEDLWYAAYDAFVDRKQAKAQYALSLDPLFFKRQFAEGLEYEVFRCGDYVPIKDDRFQLEKNIRIQKMTRNLLEEYDYSLTLSDVSTISVQTQMVLDVMDHNLIIEKNKLKDINKARMGWRSTDEIKNMVYDTDGYFDVDNIRPHSIDTNMLTVGSKSQQFLLVDIVFEANVKGNPNRFEASAGRLIHLTLEENKERIWEMAPATVDLKELGGYYVYAKCNKYGENGSFFVSQEQWKVDNTSDPNNYYFQIGILGSLPSGFDFRDFNTTYGFTRINGNTITTGRIQTATGDSYINLDNDSFKFGNNRANFSYNTEGDGILRLKGSMIQSPSGEESPLGVYRGAYKTGINYYIGDEITYGGSTYRCVKDCTSMVPTNTTYWNVLAQKGDKGDTGAQGLQGLQGPKGDQGIAGAKGADGKTTYFHIKYAPVQNPTSAQMTETPSTYIGTYVDTLVEDSTDPKKYTWARFEGLQGTNGEQGIPGKNGADGKTSYLHIKYSNDGGKTFTANNGETPGSWIGQYTDFIVDDSNTLSAYTWSKIQGDTGPQGVAGAKGADGLTTYTWIRYADNASGGGISNSPTGKLYIGMAYNKTTATESSNAADYKWALIKGDKGDTGVVGPAGKDGLPTYTWIKYSDNADGTGLYDNPKASTKYIGIAPNKTTAAESSNKTDYTWSLFKGDKGDKGDAGPQGVAGAKGADGLTTYTWIRYADNASGGGISNSPTGKLYIGMAYNKTTATESSNAADYKWALIKGDKGDTGVVGPAGKDGLPTYTWIKYSDNADGTGLYDDPKATTKYIGIAPNKTTAAESTNKADYTWSLFKGDKGDRGEDVASGRMVYRDPEFRTGYNGVGIYNNANNGVVTFTRVTKPSDCPSTSTHCLEMKHTGTASPNFGGFVQGINSRANAIFIQQFIAKLPIGYKFNTATNSMGTGYTDTFISPAEGTGKYETYIRKVVCGTTGTFGLGGHVYVSGSPTPTTTAPLVWQLASCTLYDMTDSEKYDQAISTAQAAADKAQTAANTAQTTANSAKSNADTANTLLADIADDNKLTAAEKLDTKKEWDIIASEYSKNKTQADNFGVVTTAYTAAYNALDTYVKSLKIDEKSTSSITGSVFRSNFKAYYDARTDLLNAISVKAKQLADTAQKYAENIQVGGRNLLTNSKNKTYNKGWLYVNGLNDGEVVTIQIWGEGSIQCFKDNGWVAAGTFSASNGYGKFTYQVKPFTSSTNSDGRILLLTTCTNANIKVEKGNKPTDWSPAPEDVQADIDSAKKLADTAQTTANTAKSNADTANTLLADIADDNKLTVAEKLDTKKEWDIIASEYSKNKTQADNFGVVTTAYTTAYNALDTYVKSLKIDEKSTSSITGSIFRSNFKAYYDARTDLLNAISVKAKQLADTAQKYAENIQVGGRNLVIDSLNFSKFTLSKGEIISTGNSDYIGGKSAVLLELTDTASLWDMYRQVGGLIPGEFYTISLYVLLDSAPNFVLTINDSSGWNTVANSQVVVTTKVWQKLSITIKATSSKKANIHLGANLEARGVQQKPGKVYLSHLKVEAGNKATDWSPAPEDVQTGIDEAQNSADSLSKGTRFYAGRFVFNEGAPYSTVVGFDTKIPSNVTNMWLLEISGYAYGTMQPFKTDVVFYPYNNSYINLGYTNSSAVDLSKIRIATKNSCACFEITFKTGIYYLNLEVQVVATRINATRSIADGWTKRTTVFDSTYTSIVEIPKKDTIQDLAAANALNVANKARSETDTLVANICNDNVLIPSEKTQLNIQWLRIKQDQAKIIEDADRLQISTSTLVNAYSTLNTYINPLLTDLKVNSNVTGSILRSYFDSWYSAYSSLLNAISFNASDGKRNYTIDARSLDQSTYYPVLISLIGGSLIAEIQMYHHLNGASKPTWSTHTGGFSLDIHWTTRASGWGSIGVERVILNSTYSFANVLPAGSIGQLTNSSHEVVYVRGGGIYYFTVKNAVNVRIVTTSTTINSQTIAPITSVVWPNTGLREAQTAANTAQTTANTAKSNADTANSLLADIADDNKLTATEKLDTKKEWDIIVSEYSKNITQANSFGVAATTYTSVYKALDTYVKSLKIDEKSTSSITGSVFRSNFKAYYDARTDLLNAIAVKAKQLADNAQKYAENIQVGGRNLLRNSGNWKAAGWNNGFSTNGGGYTVDSVKFNGMSTISTLVGSGIVHPWIYLENGVEYTYSAMVCCNETIGGGSQTPLHFWAGLNCVSNGKISVINYDTSVVANQWKLIHIVFKLIGDANSFRPFFYRGNNGTTKYWIAYIKLEKGNKPTDWSPAPEDVQVDIENAKNEAIDIQPNYVNKGEYNASTTYYANNERVDIVKYGGVFYRAKRKLNTTFKGQTPSNTSTYWENFGGNYESVATGMLLAENASITSGQSNELTVLNITGQVVGGLSGYGTDNSAVRLWFGGTRDQASQKISGSKTSPVKTAITKDGRLYSSDGIFDRVQITGGWKQEFKEGTYILGENNSGSFGTTGIHNVNNVYIDGSTNGWITNFQMPFNESHNGFRFCVINRTAGEASCSAPSGKYFFEDGNRYREFYLSPYEVVEGIGWGIGSAFYGYIILKRSTVNSSGPLISGAAPSVLPLRVCVSGFVTGNESAGVNQNLTFKQRYANIVDRISNISVVASGWYRVYFQTEWSSEHNYDVQLTGNSIYSGWPCYASLGVKTISYFDVYTADDDSRNNARFTFIVYWAKDYV